MKLEGRRRMRRGWSQEETCVIAMQPRGRGEALALPADCSAQM